MKKLMTLLVVLVIAIALIPAVFAAETIITSQPVDAEAPAGTYGTFTVVAEGEGLTYRWQYISATNPTWTSLSSSTLGYNEATVKIGATDARNGNQYRCRITDAAGNKYYSDPATLIVTENPNPITFTTNPADETVKLGNRANFHVVVGGEGSDNIKYQWQYQMEENGPWWNATEWTMGYNTDTLNVIAAELRQGFKYRCRVTDQVGLKYYSEVATLTVDIPEVYAITGQPAVAYAEVVKEDGTILYNQPVGGISVNGAATQIHIETQGEGLTYQWEYHRDINKTGGDYYWLAMGSTTGCKTDTLTIAGKSGSTNRDGWYYRCVVTNADGYVFTSEPARLRISTVGITSQAEDHYLALNTEGVFSVGVTGEAAKYQWKYQPKGSDAGYWLSSSSSFAGYQSTAMTVKATNARNGNNYCLEITDKNGFVFRTLPANLTVNTGAALTITTNPVDVEVELGETATFTGAASGDGVTYQWYIQLPETDTWSQFVGQTSATLKVVASEFNNGYAYKLVATDAAGNTVESAVASLIVDDGVYVLTPDAIPGTATTKKIAAGATKTYTVNAGACNMIIESETVTVAYNGTTYEPVDGVVTVPLQFVNPRLGTSNVVDITNTGSAAAVYTVKFEYPVGSMENPEVVEDLSFFYAEQPEGDTDGYYFKWTAPEAGTFTLSLSCYAEGADYNAYVTVGYTQYNWAEESVDGILTLELAEGDEVIINAFVLSQYEIDEYWNVVVDEEGNPVVIYNPESSVYLYATFASGSADYPYDLTPEIVPGSAVTNEIAAGEGEYYTTTASGTVITFNTQNVTVEYEGTTYTAANGVVSLYVEGGYDPMTRQPKPIVFKVNNIGTAAATFTANYNYPAGHSENPDTLVIGDNTASFEMGDEPYYYTWTANAAGTVTVTVSAENGWFFCVNNLTAGTYGDNNYYNDETAVNTVEIAVEAGDVLQVIVSSYDADLWGSCDGSVTVNFAFDSLINEGIETPLPPQEGDGEE